MKRILSSLILLLLAAGALPLAAAPHKETPAKAESLVEATAEMVLLPSTTNGILVFKPCKSCAPNSFRATRATVYSLAGRPLSLAELKAAIVKNPRMNIDISLSPKTREVQIVEATPQGGNK